MGGAVACGVWRVARSLIQHSTPSGATSVLANIEITEEGVGTGASPMVAAISWRGTHLALSRYIV